MSQRSKSRKSKRSPSYRSVEGSRIQPSSKSSHSRRSADIAARQAALMVEAAALEEKEKVEEEMLKLQQRAKRLELKTQIDKLQAEQAALEEATEASQSSDPSESAQRTRVAEWVNTTVGQSGPQREIGYKPLNPLAPEFHASPSPVSEDAPLTTAPALEEMIQALHMPKTEMATFDGDPIRYWTFIRAFENNVGRFAIDEHAKLTRLLQYCKDKAFQVIQSCAAMETSGYQRAKQPLHDRFGDKYSISASWIGRVTSGPKVSNDLLQEFADEMSSFKETLQAINALSEVNQRTMVSIAERLPIYLQHRWKKQAVKLREKAQSPTIHHLVEFVQSAAREVSDPVYGSLGISNNRAQQSRKGFHGTTLVSPSTSSSNQHASSQAQKGQNKRCPVCDTVDCQSLFRCAEFRKMTPDARLEVAKTYRLCFNCLRAGHSSGDCRITSTCRAEGCKRKHTKFLHTKSSGNDQHVQGTTGPDPRPEEQHTQVKATATATCTHTQSGAAKVVLPVVRVRVTGRSGRSKVTLALLDNGSTNSFCSSELINELRLVGRRLPLSLTTLHGEDPLSSTTVHELVLADVSGGCKFTAHKVYERPIIPLAADCIVKAEDIGGWKHLQGLTFPQLQEGARVELLIGQDCPDILMPLEVRASRDNTAQTPYAVRTVFGWTVNGPLPGSQRKSGASVNYISAAPLTLERQVEEFWKLEGTHLNSNKGMSREDQRALDIMENSVKLEDGHYSVAIPFRENPLSLPNNRVVAENRL